MRQSVRRILISHVTYRRRSVLTWWRDSMQQYPCSGPPASTCRATARCIITLRARMRGRVCARLGAGGCICVSRNLWQSCKFKSYTGVADPLTSQKTNTIQRKSAGKRENPTIGYGVKFAASMRVARTQLIRNACGPCIWHSLVIMPITDPVSRTRFLEENCIRHTSSISSTTLKKK